MPYPPLMVRPMREELASAGFQELFTPSDVDQFLGEKSGTALLVVNSVCGCAAGMARPGARLALADGPRPDRTQPGPVLDAVKSWPGDVVGGATVSAAASLDCVSTRSRLQSMGRD